MKKSFLILMPIIALLAACGQKHDVAFYKAHHDDRDTKIAACQSIPGAFDNDNECIAAALAEDVRPVSYWKQNGVDRIAKLAECKEHAATIGKSENCQNAGQAETESFGAGGNPVIFKLPK